MSDPNAFERFVADQFAREVRGPAATDETIHDLLTKAGHARQRPRWLAILKEPPMRYRSHVAFGSPTARVAALGAATILIALMASAALVAGAQSPAPAPQERDVAVSPPVEFTGHIVCGPLVRSGAGEWVPDAAGSRTGLARTRGNAWQPYTTEMSDPRMEGTYYISYDTDEHRRPEGTTSVGTGTWRIENEEGAWQGSFTNVDFVDHSTIVSTPLVGEGAYEGLTAIWEAVHHPANLCTWDVRGVIIEGEPPAIPEPYVGG